MKFPVYRKYANGSSYFKIESRDCFIEIQVMGNRKTKHEVVALQFPEMLRIEDMLNCKDNVWVEIKEEEYLQMLG